jgi:RNA polymerase sigma factor (sigma-70 family)
MPVITTERALWLAANILPLEPQMRGWLKRVSPAGIEIDDLIQEAYAKLAALATVENIAQPKAYFYQIVKRLMGEYVRTAHVVSIDAAAEISQLSMVDQDFSPERIVSGRQELERFYRAVIALPRPCRAVFIMRKFDDKPQKTIALELGISENVVEKRMSRALRMLLAQLQTGVEKLGKSTPIVRVLRKERRGA